MIVDTDVIIWYMRGNDKARIAIEKIENFQLSVVSYMELVQGMRNKNELRELRNAMTDWGVNVVLINETISAKALFLVERYFLSHKLELADALIASTAISCGLPIFTGNDKHYRMIDDLHVSKFHP
ncbi:MAG: type II toxin-antitoxin system VapC family toxin [Deltaproteobacteria bacterium]|nr:type II toxin-antitoxin system VapC family toxin [Deltaproteobacteria bacterium]